MHLKYGMVGLVIGLSVIILNCALEDYFPVLEGPYFGQTPPGNIPEVFAPDLISTGMYERDMAIMPDGNEIYYGTVLGNNTYSTILVTKLVEGKWTRPEVAPFCNDPNVRCLEPHISPDGKMFYFVSNFSTLEQEKQEDNWDIWVMERVGEEWTQPYNLGPPINTEAGEYYPSVTRDGTLYFTRDEENRINAIYRSKRVNGTFSEPERLPDQVNCGRTRYNAFIAQDESYIIVPVFGMDDSFGFTDYYIVFRNEQDQWSDPINMGENINTASGFEWSPYVSPDGNHFFFMSLREGKDEEFKSEPLELKRLKKHHNSPENGNPDIYWVDASFIQKLRPKGF
jgi:hypothetical protein